MLFIPIMPEKKKSSLIYSNFWKVAKLEENFSFENCRTSAPGIILRVGSSLDDKLEDCATYFFHLIKKQDPNE